MPSGITRVHPRTPPGRSSRFFLLGAGLAVLGACSAGGEDAGRLVFDSDADPPCSLCHTLRDAGATGLVGPDLDQLRPSRERVVRAVTHGIGIMPPQADRLSPEQIDAVADYVVRVAGRY